MIVKVCGMREPDNIRAVEQAGADWMGFIFFPRSPRYVDAVPAYLPVRCKRVGVFVGAETEHILHTASLFGLHAVQLHGHETPEQCARLSAEGLEVIKVFSVDEAQGLPSYAAYEGVCRYFLFDTACVGYGGSGKVFRWDLLAGYRGRTPFLLSGGLSPDSLKDLLGFAHDQWAGIDLNSGFETEPARKDAAALQTFIEQVKQYIQ